MIGGNTGDDLIKSTEEGKKLTPEFQTMVKNFNADGIELKVPGAPDAEEPAQDGETSQEKVDATADTAAPQQLAQQNQTPTPPPIQA